MEQHGREKETAAWLAREYGGNESKSLFIVRAGSPETAELTWPKVQRRLAQLIREDKFFTEQEKSVLEQNRNYLILDRLRADCEYFLGAGNRAEKHLWAGSVYAQIVKMRELHDAIPQKPEWLTKEMIDDYADRMAPQYQVVAYHHLENGFDEKRDYQTLEEAEKAAQGYVDGTMESDGFAYDGAAIYDQQARKYLRIYGDYPDERAHAEVAGGEPTAETIIPADRFHVETPTNPASRYMTTSGKSSSPEESPASRSHSSMKPTPKRGRRSCLQRCAPVRCVCSWAVPSKWARV